MNVLALCAGVGGLELGIKIANPSTRCVCYVEGEGYAASILVKRMEEKVLDEAPLWSDVRTFDGIAWRGKVDCVAGGYPCQPFSLPGKRKGKDDPRHLWPSIRRIIEEIEPQRCFFENVANHLRMGFEEVHDDLQGMGYRVAAGIFAAEEVGASHERERLFIFARKTSGSTKTSVGEAASGSGATFDILANPQCSGGKRIFERDDGGHVATVVNGGGDGIQADATPQRTFAPGPSDLAGWDAELSARGQLAPAIEPAVFGMAHGVSDWVDRCRVCGNAVVPLVAAYAWRILEDSIAIEDRS